MKLGVASATTMGADDYFGELDLPDMSYHEDFPDEPVPPTVPSPGSATLDVEDKCEALFTSVEWSIVAKVGTYELGRSSASAQSHTSAYTARWTRELIRSNRDRLRRLGVDIPATYIKCGGDPKDLDD